MSDVMDPRLKPLALGYGQGLSEFMMAIDRVSVQKEGVDWNSLKPAEFNAIMAKELGVTVATFRKKVRWAHRYINREFSVHIGGSIIHPEFRVGDEVNYGFPRDKAGRPTLKGVKVTEITYYAGMGEFRYWIEGLGHDVDEDELIWWTPMSQRLKKK